MTRYTLDFALSINRSYLIILILGMFAITYIGCVGGVDIVPLSAKIQNADNAFDEAEAVSTRSDDPEEKRKIRARQQKAYDRAMSLYLEVIAKDVKGKYAQRAHYQIAKIYKKHYEWDKANEHYQAIIELDPTGYYASEAKSSLSNIRKNRELIAQELANYQNYKALYDIEKSDETYDIAAKSLYKVAQAYETLENFPEAITTFERMAKEFAEHPQAPQAQFQVGNIYFYKLYDYTNSGGWGAFIAVNDKFPDTFEAQQVKSKLIEAKDLLTDIKKYQDEIRRYRSKKAEEFEKLGRYVRPSEKWLMGKVELVVQLYQQIARNWKKLRHYPYAIETYKELIRDLSHKKFAVSDALYQVGVLYQQSGQYERAIQAYDDLLEEAPQSTWLNESIYQQAVCYRAIREFGSAYKGFKTYLSLTKGDTPYFREAEQIIRQYELDQDQDGYKFYEEQESGTSDQDPNSYPVVKN